MREQQTRRVHRRRSRTFVAALVSVALLACGESAAGPELVYDLNGTWSGAFAEGAETAVSVELVVDEGGGLGGSAAIGSDSALVVVGRYAHPVVYLEIGPGPEIQMVGEMHQADLIVGFATSRVPGQADGLLRLRSP